MREGDIGMEFDVWLICNFFKGYPVIYVECMALHWPLGSMECYSKIFVGFKGHIRTWIDPYPRLLYLFDIPYPKNIIIITLTNINFGDQIGVPDVELYYNSLFILTLILELPTKIYVYVHNKHVLHGCIQKMFKK